MQLLVAIAFVLAACKPDASSPPATGSGSAAGPGSAGSAIAPPGDGPGATPNEFLARGTPTFVLGTAGDDRADRDIAVQVELLHALLFPAASVVTDTSVGAVWPVNPVLYGGPHVNQLVATIAPCLTFALSAGHLAIGGQSFDRDDVVLVTVVPAHAADAVCPGHPEFLLYAGTGTPGVVGINTATVTRGAAPIAIADGLGQLHAGAWQGGVAVLGPATPRPEWTRIAREQSGVAVTFAVPAGAPTPEVSIDACLRGVARVVTRLGLESTSTAPLAVTIYLHVDKAAKQAATGNSGDGHAIAFARALHVTSAVPPTALESLVAHEATHVLVAQAWGATASPLLGEGIALFTSGQYRGRTLARWSQELAGKPPAVITDLLGKRFTTMPELEAYPIAGLVVDAVVATVGLAALRDHLYRASVLTWADACRAAGTTPDALQAAFASRLR